MEQHTARYSAITTDANTPYAPNKYQNQMPITLTPPAENGEHTVKWQKRRSVRSGRTSRMCVKEYGSSSREEAERSREKAEKRRRRGQRRRLGKLCARQARPAKGEDWGVARHQRHIRTIRTITGADQARPKYMSVFLEVRRV